MNNPTSTGNDYYQSLIQALEQQHSHILCMLDILNEEHRTLSSTDIGNFERVVVKKQAQVKRLEETKNQLNLIGDTTGGNLSSYIERMSEGKNKSHIRNLWDDFQETVDKCRQQNLINNRIMDASSTHLRQSIRILRGDTSESAAGLYGASGQQKNKLQGQSLAIA